MRATRRTDASMANFILTQGAPAKPFWEHIQDMQFDEADKKAAMQVAHI